MDKEVRDALVGIAIVIGLAMLWSSWDNPRWKAALTFGWIGVTVYDAAHK